MLILRKNMSQRPDIRETLKILPTQPGVYRFVNKEGIIIYIGKAKNLRNRVTQYFQSENTLSPKTKAMVSKIDHIEHTVVNSEEEALLLENNLIKKYQPRYNILLKDSKTYPWICIKNEPFPRVFVTRKYNKDGSLYFGPYSSAMYAHSLIDLINTLYQIRNCKLSLTELNIKTKNFRPCLNYHIGKCKAPCAGYISDHRYVQQIDGVKSILKGETSRLKKEFKESMLKAAKEMRFEEAQNLKEKLDLLEKHYSKSTIVNPLITNIDVFSLAQEHTIAFGNFLRVVNGSVIQSLNLEFRLQIEESMSDVMSTFMAEIRSKFGELSSEIIVSVMPDENFSGKQIHIPHRGDKLKLLELSIKNANQFKIERIKQEETLRPEDHFNRILSTLQKDLNMDKLPIHIECFDNSNIQGQYAVAACVVFKDGMPSKNDYRHFNIKSVVGANDFATMKEVVNRRYSRLLAENSPLPQLIVVDGGRGQLNYAYEALRELDLHDKIKIIGIAKRLEELIIPGDPDPLFLDKNSSSLKLIMHLRDEAHRFGIKHHRNQRSKGQINSELRQIKGIGEKKEELLLGKFKSLKAIKNATYEELVETVGGKTAKIIYDYYHK